MNSFQSQILENIHQEMVSGKFTDVTVTCKDGTTTASRLVLAALSPYFQGMFSSDMAEARTGILELPSVSLAVFQDILKAYFCGVNPVKDDNWMQFLDAAEMMQLDHVKQLCIIYLEKHLNLTPANCFQWWRNLKMYNLFDLAKQALCFLKDNMADFVQTETFVQLTKAEVLEILANDDMSCEETDILKAVFKWIEHNNPEQDDIQAIFQQVRLELVDRQFVLNEVVFSNVFLQNEAVRKHVQNTISSYMVSPTSTTRRSTPKRSDVFILHHHGNSLLSCFTSEHKWEEITPAPVDPGLRYSATRLDNTIYITGGWNKRKSTLLYDICNKTWSVGPDLQHDRCAHCSATANSKVYVLGGCYSNAVEEWDDGVAQWQVVGDLKQWRQNACCVTVGENILVMGGLVNGKKSDLIDCFNVRTHCVTALNTKLPFTSSVLRANVHFPDVYLMDNNGYAIHMHISDEEGELNIEYKLTRKLRSCRSEFGILHSDENLFCFSKNGISRFNLANGKEDQTNLPNPPRTGEVYDVLST